jgi:acyl-CoA hydrolase
MRIHAAQVAIEGHAKIRRGGAGASQRHTQDGVRSEIALVQSAVERNQREVDGALLQAAFFLGSRAFYRALRDLPEAELAKLRMTSVLFVNELYGDEAAKRRARVKGRFINNAMMATLLGNVVSDALENGQVVSGVGGQYNFVAQAFALEDARSIIMVRATREANRRTTSNIRWTYGHQTIPRHLRDVFVTEYGVAHLRGCSLRERARRLLAIAHPDHRETLERSVHDGAKAQRRAVPGGASAAGRDGAAVRDDAAKASSAVA